MVISLCFHALPLRYRIWTQKSTVPIILQPNGLKALRHLFLLKAKFSFTYNFWVQTLWSFVLFVNMLAWLQALVDKEPLLAST